MSFVAAMMAISTLTRKATQSIPVDDTMAAIASLTMQCHTERVLHGLNRQHLIPYIYMYIHILHI